MALKVLMDWAPSSFSGWGVYGTQLALHWVDDPELSLSCTSEPDARHLVLDPLQRRALAPFLAATTRTVAALGAYSDVVLTAEAAVLTAMGNNFSLARQAEGVRVRGRPTIALVFFERPELTADALARARDLPCVIVGSSWNAELLRAQGVRRVTTVLQGVDPALFHPAPRRGLFPERFVVFSGGKLEDRKGQDIALLAFRAFAQRHRDALLVTAWHNPWPETARSLDTRGLAAPVTFDGSTGQVDVRAWAQANGINPSQVLDLGAIPNGQLPAVLREMDVALFTNRAEGGTNLVAMEAMACGLPVILSANIGHLDLIAEGNCYPLFDQRPVPGAEGIGGVAGWGESSVEEAEAALEAAWRDRDEARRRGARAAETLARLPWSATAAGVKRAVLATA
jgi:glycosyltransferase involved in cell wall biosynthesis